MPTYRAYAIVGAVAAIATLVATPLVRRLAIRIGAVVEPDERRIHTRPTPTLGGVAMFVGFCAALATAWSMDSFHDVFLQSSEPLGVLLAAAVMVLVGSADDLREWSAPAKVAGQVLSATLLWWFGVVMFYFSLPFLDLVVLSNDIKPLVTVLWVLGIANAINLIDGLDGLAAGITAIASGAFFLYATRLQSEHVGVLDTRSIGPLLAIIVFGMCVGFLPFNFNPARIFMGDCGALLLGVLMAASTSVVGGRVTQRFSGQKYFFFAPLFIPLVVLGVPVLDMLFAIVRRATRRQSWSEADKEHLHHRLMKLGHGQRRSVLILWLWTALLSGFVLFPAYNDGAGNAIVPLGIAALGLILYTVLHPGVRKARSAAE
jgi:UDP-GlcNAc:undecaprenyl-phosphate/decaprenyl-phosphate GlcNAc-1-phosphate transferase